MATKTLAASGGDYTAATLQSGYIDTYLAGLGTFSADEILEVDVGEYVFTAGWDFTNVNSGSFKVIIRPQTGDGFAAAMNPASDPLRYGAFGARLKFNNYGYSAFKGLGNAKIQLDDMAIYRSVGADFEVFTTALVGELTMNGCLVDVAGGGDIASGGTFNSCVFSSENGRFGGPFYNSNRINMKNCTLVFPGSSTVMFAWGTANALFIYNTLFINNGSADPCTLNDGSTGTIQNCAANNSVINGVTTTHQISVTPTAVIQNATWGTHDARALTSGVLKDNGSDANKYSPDIYGTARDSTPYIGAHEADTSGGGFQAAWARRSNIIIGGGPR